MRRLLVCVMALACEVAPGGYDGDTEAAADDGVPDGPCVPGQSVACGCGGEMGAATCRADGSGFGSCSCDETPGDAGSGNDDANDDDNNGSITSADESGGSESGSAESSGPAGVPSWTNDIVPILYSSCGADVVGCHTRDVYNPDVNKGCLNWVSFEDALLGSVFTAGDNIGQPTGCPDLPLYDRVVNRSPWQCGAFFGDPQALLVVPGDPDNSYMIQKIRGITCDASLQMPPMDQDIQISDADVDTLIEWIAAGAPR